MPGPLLGRPIPRECRPPDYLCKYLPIQDRTVPLLRMRTKMRHRANAASSAALSDKYSTSVYTEFRIPSYSSVPAPDTQSCSGDKYWWRVNSRIASRKPHCCVSLDKSIFMSE